MVFLAIELSNIYGGFKEARPRVHLGKSVTIRAGQGGGHIPSLIIEGKTKDFTLETFKKCIRKVTPLECERLQTLPDNYTEGISPTQRYKCIGNGWTVAVIAYILLVILKYKSKIKKGEKEMELQIYSPSEDGFIKEISWNYEEIKKEVAEKVSFYADLVYTEDQIKTAKEDRAKLRKFVDALETKRKEIKKQCLAPYEAFEAQMKEIVSIVNKPIMMIDGQVKEFEESKKAEKLEAIKDIWNNGADFQDKPSFLKFEAIFETSWLNASVSMKTIDQQMFDKLGQIEKDLATLAVMPQFSFEATEIYKDTLDINKAIAEGRRLSEIQKKKEEAERLKAEQEAAKKAEAVVGTVTAEINVDGQAVPVAEISVKAPEKQWVSFSALLSTEDAHALKEFFNNRNIEFKAIRG